MTQGMRFYSKLSGAILAIAVLIVVPYQATKPKRMLVTTSPSDVGLIYQSFLLSPSDSDLQLNGWWMPAPRDKAKATLVFIHGGGSHRASPFFGSLKFYRAMVDAGISVAAVDLRNHGNSDGDSDGMQFGRTESYDVIALIDWVRRRNSHLPLFAMGISMGGASVIHAVERGATPNGLILLDSLLDSHDTFVRGGWINTGLPSVLFYPSAFSATTLFGLPGGPHQALAVASALELPILAIQDPDDPITRSKYARQLAENNANVFLWETPLADKAQQKKLLGNRGRWGTHVGAFLLFPEQTVAQITAFIDRHSGAKPSSTAVGARGN